MFLRYIAFVVVIVAVHVAVIWGLVTRRVAVQPPQVVMVSLMGSVITPAAAKTPSPEPVARPAPEKPTPVEPKPKQQEPVVKPEKPKESKPKEPTPKPQPKTEKPKPAEVKPNPKPPVNATETVTRQETTTSGVSEHTAAEQSQQSTSSASSAHSGASQSGDADQKVTKPSTNASYLNNARPPYPSMSRRLKEEGVVVLHVLVSAEGKAQKVELKRSSGFDRLDQSALDTVKNWRFVPAKRGDTPIDMWYDIPVKFSLKNS